ncbi:hypothetical protein ACFCV9_40070 [Streptomyces sp. NPDC056367]|uniref:hypothetical protein n=1 Tax=Streptomyces sp. NPDC056367 TaxID=3345797 RepID=UPI0035DEA7FA
MTVSVVLFTSDLRLHDHPPLRAAVGAGRASGPRVVRDPVSYKQKTLPATILVFISVGGG